MTQLLPTSRTVILWELPQRFTLANYLAVPKHRSPIKRF
nr:MAG TPA: hypothetical protein [Caudoviricetes sp.]